MKTDDLSSTINRVSINRTVLLVEEVENMRLTTSRMLLDMGFKEVICARNGLEALKYLQEHNVDIIISDWLMAKMDGMTLLQNIRSHQSTADLPFIMSTTIVEQDQVKAAIKAGVSEYVAKPFNFVRLAKHIEKAFTNPLNKRLKTTKPSQDELTSQVERRKRENNFLVLLVSDNNDEIEMITAVIKPLVRVKLASKAKKALALCHSSNPPDLVLLDTTMAHLNGFKFIEVFKGAVQTQNIPLVFLAQAIRPEDVSRGFALGAVDYINKPINAAEVNARVNQQKTLWQYQHSQNSQLETVIENVKLQGHLDRMDR
ncbi:MAG: two-component system sensor histidine kinase/response regulator [Phenylobacterium sp.]|jgi:two-component system sensor histidine kinase/response regulator